MMEKKKKTREYYRIKKMFLLPYAHVFLSQDEDVSQPFKNNKTININIYSILHSSIIGFK